MSEASEPAREPGTRTASLPALSEGVATPAPFAQRLAESIQAVITEEMKQREETQRAVIEQLLRANQEMGEVLRGLIGPSADDSGPAGPAEQQALENLLQQRIPAREASTPQVPASPPLFSEAPEPTVLPFTPVADSPPEVADYGLARDDSSLPYAETWEPVAEVQPEAAPAEAAAEIVLEPPVAEQTEPPPAQPCPGEAAYARGEQHRERGAWDQAILQYSVALQLDPNYTPAYLGRGLAYRSRREHERALEDFENAIRLNPADPEAYLRRGNTRMDRGELDEAIADYSNALELDDRFAVAYMNRGLAFAKRGEFRQVVEDSDRALDCDPNLPGAYYIRGAGLIAMRRYEEAVRDLNHLINVDPNNALAYNERGLAHANQGEYDKAILDYARALKLNPRLLLARFNRAVAYRLKGDHELAIAGLTEVLRAKPKLSTAYFERGIAHLARNDPAAALADFETTLKLNPGFAKAQEKHAEALRIMRRTAPQTQLATPPATPRSHLAEPSAARRPQLARPRSAPRTQMSIDLEEEAQARTPPTVEEDEAADALLSAEKETPESREEESDAPVEEAKEVPVATTAPVRPAEKPVPPPVPASVAEARKNLLSKKPAVRAEKEPFWTQAKLIAAGLAAAVLIGVASVFLRSGPSGPEIPVATMSSKDLVREFKDDADYAKTTYCRQLVQITGVIKSVEGSADQPSLIVLGDKGKDTGTVFCAPGPQESKETLGKVGKGRQAVIRGVCEGPDGDSGVKLVDCRIVSVN